MVDESEEKESDRVKAAPEDLNEKGKQKEAREKKAGDQDFSG